MVKRAGLIISSVLALPLAALWWLYAGLATGDYEGICPDSLAAEMGAYAAYAGFLLALGALVAAVGPKRLDVAAWLLLVYATLFGLSVLAVVTC